MNKNALRRICEILDISPQTYYNKLDWLYGQALAFTSQRERKLLESFEARRLYLSTDRQAHIVNWRNRIDKRNTELLAIGTADNRSGYIFGWSFNFDPSLNRYSIEREAELYTEYEAGSPHHKFARVWLDEEFREIAAAKVKAARGRSGFLEADVAARYEDEEERDNPESSEIIDETVKLPDNGMQVHSEYTMYGHFQLLNSLLKNVEKVRFYLDQDSGVRGAFMSAFTDRVIERSADAFYVSVTKGLTIDEKNRLASQARQRVARAAGTSYRNLSMEERNLVIEQLVIEQMQHMRTYRGSKDSWLSYPFSTRSEPEKMIAALTDIGNLSPSHQARLYMNASLHGIDRFFMLARRRVNFFERPFATGTSAGRKWYGYNAYDPSIMIKMAELYRLFYNYVHNDTKDKKTPAMRLGLAKGPVSYEKIIYFDR